MHEAVSLFIEATTAVNEVARAVIMFICCSMTLSNTKAMRSKESFRVETSLIQPYRRSKVTALV